MDFAYSLSGALPLQKKFQIAATIAIAGVMHLTPGSSLAGVAQATTTGAADAVGVNLDTATYATAQVAGGTPEALVTLIINPDAVWKLRMSGGATSGTALGVRTVTSVSSTGLVVTTGDDWSSPTFDEGAIWGYDGANAGQLRKITTVSSTVANVVVAFANDTVVGDNFLYAPYWGAGTSTIQFTTELYEADASIAVGTGAAMRCVELRTRDISAEGKLKSFVYAIADDHIFKDAT